jgi:hypothetical protein
MKRRTGSLELAGKALGHAAEEVGERLNPGNDRFTGDKPHHPKK